MAAPRCRAHPSCGLAVPPPSCPVAVGRDVPIAPPRHRRGARLGMPRPVAARPRSRPVVWCRGFAAEGVTGRRALRGYRGRTETPPAKLSACATCHYPRHLSHGALPTATGRCGAIGTSRPTAITHAKLARAVRTRITHDHGAMRRDAWPQPPVGAPHPPRLAPPHLGAVRGLASRIFRTLIARAP